MSNDKFSEVMKILDGEIEQKRIQIERDRENAKYEYGDDMRRFGTIAEYDALTVLRSKIHAVV